MNLLETEGRRPWLSRDIEDYGTSRNTVRKYICDGAICETRGSRAPALPSRAVRLGAVELGGSRRCSTVQVRVGLALPR